ncbi:hypothetical protein MKX01_005320 [Papaver californicum]|nr:hypothetical protein MKX01_005320 [Papaver californicum]
MTNCGEYLLKMTYQLHCLSYTYETQSKFHGGMDTPNPVSLRNYYCKPGLVQVMGFGTYGCRWNCILFVRLLKLLLGGWEFIARKELEKRLTSQDFHPDNLKFTAGVFLGEVQSTL